MCQTVKEAQARALGLLEAGHTPEYVEWWLGQCTTGVHGRTALSDPTNVLMQEVTKMAQPRGPIEIKGVTTRTNTSETRSCPSCLQKIDVGVRYERVARDEHTIESYHVACFEEEFGARELYGD
jgi:hypothetical protein